MTKPSRPKRKHETRWTITTLKKSTARGNVFPDHQRKSNTRPVGTLKQLNIIPKEKKSVLNFTVWSLTKWSYLSCVQLFENFGPFKLWSGFKKIKDYKYWWPISMAQKAQSLLQKSASWISSKAIRQWMQIPEPFWSYFRRYSESAKGFHTKIS